MKNVGNPPYSPYHHKTEMPGMPGHHRLSGIKRKQCMTTQDMKKIKALVGEIKNLSHQAGASKNVLTEKKYNEKVNLKKKEIDNILRRNKCNG